MTKAAEDVFQQVLRLDPLDRAELVDRLIESADHLAEHSAEPSDDPAYAAAWEAEIRARIASIDSGEETPIPWRDVMEHIRRGEGDDE